MKKIVIFSTAYFPHVGGAEVAIKEISDRLAGAFEFDLICARYNRNLPRVERIGAVTVYRVGPGVRLIDKLLVPWLGMAFAISRSYDLYWAMMVSYASGGAYLARAFTNTPILLTLQEGDPPEYLARKWFGLVALSWRLALKRSAAVSVISSYLGALAKQFGYEGEPVLIPNGVDTHAFGVELHSPHDGTRLVTTSRLVHKNAVDDVIRALAMLPDTVIFDIYGTGPLAPLLKELARKLKVESRVRFNGQIPYEKLPEVLAASDIFIRPSRSEGMGNSFIEAMAAGLPVIATQEGGIADFLFDAKRNPGVPPTGYAVDANSPSQIAEAVLEIIANPEQVAATCENASRLVAEKYDWNTVALSMRQIFEKVLQ